MSARCNGREYILNELIMRSQIVFRVIRIETLQFSHSKFNSDNPNHANSSHLINDQSCSSVSGLSSAYLGAVTLLTGFLSLMPGVSWSQYRGQDRLKSGLTA